MIVDTIALYKIVTKIVAPFTKWDAFRAGVIDAEGNILVPPQKRTYQQASTMTAFDVLCLNLKRALAKIPGGSSPLGLSAAFLYYLREPGAVTEGHDASEALKTLMEEGPAMAAGNGAIAGIGVGPQGEPPKPEKKKKSEASVINSILRRNYRVNSISNVGSR